MSLSFSCVLLSVLLSGVVCFPSSAAKGFSPFLDGSPRLAAGSEGFSETSSFLAEGLREDFSLGTFSDSTDNSLDWGCKIWVKFF